MGRARERGLLVVAIAVGVGGSALVAFARGGTFDGADPGSLPRQAAVWLQLGLAALLVHGWLARRRSTADETLLPASIGLTAVGLTIIYSLSPAEAQAQVVWLWVSLGLLALVVAALPSLDGLREYTFLWGLATVLLLLAPMLFGREVNGARLWIDLGFVRLQPSEPAKLTLVLFLASYLSSARGGGLAGEAWRVGPFALPAPRYLVPLVVMWAGAMLVLITLRDLGTALLFFGTFICMVYAATGQVRYLLGGMVSFALGAWAAAQAFGHVRGRITAWLNPWVEPTIGAGGYQIVQALFAVAAGGMTGVGLGFSQLANPLTGRLLFASTTDLPFAAVCEQVGVWGAAMVVGLYGFWVYRALRLAVVQRDEFAGLLATGIAVLMALQSLVIMGGVVKLIPLTGITLPFVSYGGSSLLVNYVMLALLLRCAGEQP